MYPYTIHNTVRVYPYLQYIIMYFHYNENGVHTSTNCMYCTLVQYTKSVAILYFIIQSTVLCK